MDGQGRADLVGLTVEVRLGPHLIDQVMQELDGTIERYFAQEAFAPN